MTPYYQDSMVTIYHGDCLDVLPAIGGTGRALFITDPPYGINTKSDGSGKINPWQDLMNAANWYATWIGLCKGQMQTGGMLWSFLNWRAQPTFMKASAILGWPIESLAVWNKDWIGPGGGLCLRPSYEMIAMWTFGGHGVTDRSQPDVFTQKWSAHKPTGHPAEKPEALIGKLIDISSADGVVVDPFMGSGTTLAAARARQRISIGIEADEKWCERAARRIAQMSLFEDAA